MIPFTLDAHVHLGAYQNPRALIEHLEQARQYTLCVTNLPSEYARLAPCCVNLKYVKAAVGFHPALISQVDGQELELLVRQLPTTRYVGEVGLDFSTPSTRDKQLQIFKTILQNCSAYGNKVLSVHSRRAVPSILSALHDFCGRVILHWYSGSIADLRHAASLGCFFSVNHAMLRSTSGRAIISSIPRDRLLTESDAPYTPGHRPCYQPELVQELRRDLSKLLNLSEQELSILLRENFKSLLQES